MTNERWKLQSSVPQGNMPFLFHFLSKWQDRDHLLIQTLSVFLPGVTHFDVPRNVCHVPPNPTLCHLYYTFQAFLVVYRHPLTHGGLRAYGSENRDPAALPTDPPASYIISFLWRLTPDGENKRQALFRDLLAPTDWNPVLDACAEGQGVPATHLHEDCLVTEPISLSHFQHQIAIRATERMK